MKSQVQKLLEDVVALKEFNEKIHRMGTETVGESFLAESNLREIKASQRKEMNAKKLELQHAWEKSPSHKGFLPMGMKNEQNYARKDQIRKMRIQLEKSEKILEKEYWKLKAIQSAYDGLLNVPEVDQYLKSLEINMNLKVILEKKLEFLMEHAYPEWPLNALSDRRKNVPENEEIDYNEWKKNPDKIYSWLNWKV